MRGRSSKSELSQEDGSSFWGEGDRLHFQKLKRAGMLTMCKSGLAPIMHIIAGTISANPGGREANRNMLSAKMENQLNNGDYESALKRAFY